MAEEHAENGLTQADVARELGVNRSVINRTLSGGRDIMSGRVAQMAAAMGRDVQISFPKRAAKRGNIVSFTGPIMRSSRDGAQKVTSIDAPASDPSPTTYKVKA